MRKFLVALLTAGGLMASAHADVQITFGGLNISYDGSQLFDTGGFAGGDVIEDLKFFDEDTNTQIGVTISGARLDFEIAPSGQLAVPPLFGSVSVPGFSNFFRITWTDPITSVDYELALGSSDVIVTVAGTSTGNLSTLTITNPTIDAQTLPFGIVLSAPVTFDLSGPLNPPNTTTSGGFYTAFTVQRANGNVTASQVPEPAVLGLLGIGLLAMGLRRGRKRHA